MTNQKDIDRLIQLVGWMVDETVTVHRADLEIAYAPFRKPKAAIRGVMTVNPNPCFENSYQVPAIEATPEVEAWLACEIDVGKIERIISGARERTNNNVFSWVIANEIVKYLKAAAPAIEEKS